MTHQCTTRLLPLCAAALLVGAAAPALGQPVFTPLPSSFFAESMAADGSVLAGWQGQGLGGSLPALWTQPGGVQTLPLLPDTNYGRVVGLSADGSVAVGLTTVNGSEALSRATMWQNAQPTALGHLPGGTYSGALAVSGNGTAVTGWSSIGDGTLRAFTWAQAQGMQSLGDADVRATAVNYDGTVIAGRQGSSAFRWTASGGMQSLGTTAGGFSMSEAGAISADGTAIAGLGSVQLPGSDPEFGMFRWTEQAGLEYLGAIPPAPFTQRTGTHATAMSASGDAIVGFSRDEWAIDLWPEIAVYWSRATGLVDLNEYLPSLGVDLTGYTLTGATAISADGSIIAGHWAASPGGFVGGSWMVTGIPAPGAGGLLGLAGLCASVRRGRR